jgi:Domain of unknown function (DUF4375)
MAYESDALAMKLNEFVASHEAYMWLMWFDELEPAEKALVGTWELVNEVYNGGFVQYFHNSSGAHAKPMVEVLQSVGAHQAADILQSAIAVAGPGTVWGDEPNYLTAIKSIPDDIKRQIKNLERNFYDELDNIHLQLFGYLSKHRDQIEAPAEFWREETLQ